MNIVLICFCSAVKLQDRINLKGNSIMKVIIAGASGFIGRQLVLELARAGHECLALVRSRESLDEFPCKTAIWSAENSADISGEDFSGYNAIINLAGESVASGRWNSRTKAKIKTSRVQGMKSLRKILAALDVDKRPGLLISASAIGFYGDRGDEILNEDSEAGDGFLAEVVKAWEYEADQFRELGTRVVKMRMGVVLGAGGGALAQIKPVVLGDGRQWMSWVHIQDVIRFVQYALENKTLEGAYNLCAPNPVPNLDFVKILSNQNRNGLLDRITISVPSIFIQAGLGEMSSVFMSSCRALPKRAIDSGFKFKFENLASALEDIFSLVEPNSFRLSYTQFIKRDLNKVFEFFSKAENLEAITPDWLHFKIRKTSTPEIQNGTLIDYSLKIHGIPVHWQSKIESWTPPHSFRDIQIKGPYKKWDHTHRFESFKDGTLIQDDIIFDLPAGLFGKLFAGSFVRRDVESIFSFRKKKIREIFE